MAKLAGTHLANKLILRGVGRFLGGSAGATRSPRDDNSPPALGNPQTGSPPFAPLAPNAGDPNRTPWPTGTSPQDSNLPNNVVPNPGSMSATGNPPAVINEITGSGNFGASAPGASATPQAPNGPGGSTNLTPSSAAASSNPLASGQLVASNGIEPNDKLTRSGQLLLNQMRGEATEQRVRTELQQTHLLVAEQVTIRTRSGAKSRLDFVTLDPDTGEIRCIECKSSPTAPLSENQRLVHFELERSGGIVVGAGKPNIPGGMRIPPTKVRIIRDP